ncbi:MAG: hypothetical protein AAGI92_02060 [Pseudomonadota bacterium]
MRKKTWLSFVSTFVIFAGALAPAAAQERTPPSGLSLQLNTVQQLEDGTCRIVFVADNGTSEEIEKMSVETVLFGPDGTVNRFTLFDFRDLPAGKTRVRQFDLGGTECTSIGRILVNGAADCTIGGAASGVCIEKLATSSAVDVEFSG